MAGTVEAGGVGSGMREGMREERGGFTHPGIQSEMHKQPHSISDKYRGSDKLRGKVRAAAARAQQRDCAVAVMIADKATTPRWR